MNDHPKDTIILLPHHLVLSNVRNPRSRFDPDKNAELLTSFQAHGFKASVSHLLVRPHPAQTDKYELVCGERRWRAAGELIGYGKLASEVPVVIEEMDDAKMLEMQLIENLRDDLTPLEEAEGYRQMLLLRTGEGQAVHTVKTLAQRIGRSEMHVSDRLKICRLRGTMAGEALEGGELTLTHARLLARVPAGKLRDDLTRRVLKPADGLGVMPYRQLERTIREECMVELRGARFDPADPKLVEVVTDETTGERIMGGACGDCPYNTKNAESDEKGSKVHMCMNPECFRLKTARAHELWMAGVADEAKGRSALTVNEAEKVFDYTGKKLGPYGGFVELDAAPDETDLKRGVKDPGSWKKLVRGQGVPVVLAKDADGKVHELVKRDLAMAAARQNEAEKPAAERMFKAESKSASAPPTPAGGVDAQQAQREAEFAARRREARIGTAQLGALVFAARVDAVPTGFWSLAAEALIECVDEHGDAPDVAQRQGFPEDQDIDGTAEWLRKFARTGTLPEQIGLTVDLLLTLMLPPERTELLPKWAKVFGLDLKAVRKQVERDIDTEEKAEAAKVKEKAESEVAVELNWDKFTTEVADFHWNEHQVAESPDVILLKFAKSSKLTGSVGVACNERGWHPGGRVKGADWGNSAPCSATGANYATRELALKAGLLAVLQAMQAHDVSGAALDYVNRLIEQVSASGQEPTPAAQTKPKRK